MLSLLMQGSPAAPTYVDDVFSAYTRTGTGASAVVTTGINLSANGGLVWTKGRSGATDHKLTDTVRGVQKGLVTNSTAAQTTDTNGITAFGTTGHTVGSDSNYNTNGATYVDWVFRKSAKFFDIVTYTGNGTTQALSHSLGQAPGMVVVKRTDTTGDWYVWHRSATSGNYLILNTTAAQASTVATTKFGNNTITVDPTSTQFTVGSYLDLNFSGGTYVAYLFAHDTATDGLIQCGLSSTNGQIDLGWEPQYFLFKLTASTQNWGVMDTSRGLSQTQAHQLHPDTSEAEAAWNGAYWQPNATGILRTFNSGQPYIYLAIRRPNKPPTLGTQVYNAIARTGTGAAATVTGVGFAPDLFIGGKNRGTGNYWMAADRLRSAQRLLTTAATDPEQTNSDLTKDLTSFNMDGYTVGTANWFTPNTSGQNYVDFLFKRAPGVFDEVCYTGTGIATTIPHNLAVAPELIIAKRRNSLSTWRVYAAPSGNTGGLVLNDTAAFAADSTIWNSTSPTSSVFSIGTSGDTNPGGSPVVAYLFATKAGISKVGSYTGDGTTGQTINCGFTTGARFVLIKRTDSTGDWYVWDSTRGIVAGNDPHLSLNTTAAEVTTDDSVDTDNSGFIVNQVAATNVNVNTATYIFLAFA